MSEELEIEKKEPIVEHKPEGESRIERLINELEDTNNILRKTFSIRMIILRGLVTGLAIVIGSTIVAGVLLSSAKAVFGDIPYFISTPPYFDPTGR